MGLFNKKQDKHQVIHVYNWLEHSRTTDYYIGNNSISTIIDLNTGVNYVFAHAYECYEVRDGGYGWGYGGLTVQLLPDGKPLVYSKDEILMKCEGWTKYIGKGNTTYIFHVMGEEFEIEKPE